MLKKKIKQHKVRAINVINKKLIELKQKINNESGQGTTEYAILVGVLVVIAILAIVVFRPKLEELWNSIAEGINGL